MHFNISYIVYGRLSEIKHYIKRSLLKSIRLALPIANEKTIQYYKIKYR